MTDSSRLTILLLLLLCLMPLSAMAGGTAERDYQKAREDYRQLVESPKKRQYRENWQRVIGDFQSVARKYPGHQRAAAALYMAGKASRELYSVSRRPSDAVEAVEYFDALAQRHPKNSLADDALVLAGEILEDNLRDYPQAYLRYHRAVEDFPAGDMAAVARKKEAELRSHAPVRTARANDSGPIPTGEAVLTDIRFWSNPGYTRIVLNLSARTDFTARFLPAEPGGVPRLYVDINGVAPGTRIVDQTLVDDGLLRHIRTGRPASDTVRVVLDLLSFKDYKVFPLEDPFRIVIDVAGDRPMEIPAAAASPPQPAAQPTIARLPEKPQPDPSFKIHVPPAPASGLRRIVVDAGHGGRDPGAVGPSGVMEKDITLALARVLGRRLEKALGCEVILTRNSDIYLPLEERTAIANKAGADLFISIHINASTNREAFGVETYYLNFSKNEQAAAVAARENGTSLKQVGDLELILFDLMAHSKINESSRLAAEIQKSMVHNLGRHYSDIRDLGVRQGPFYVLLGATMPSVLVEAAFISNKREEKRLLDSRYHERTADAIVSAVRTYATSQKMIAAND